MLSLNFRVFLKAVLYIFFFPLNYEKSMSTFVAKVAGSTQLDSLTKMADWKQSVIILRCRWQYCVYFAFTFKFLLKKFPYGHNTPVLYIYIMYWLVQPFTTTVNILMISLFVAADTVPSKKLLITFTLNARLVKSLE